MGSQRMGAKLCRQNSGKFECRKDRITISADNASYPPSISGIQNGITAYAIQQMEWTAGGKKITLEVSGGATEFVFMQYILHANISGTRGKLSKSLHMTRRGLKGIPALLFRNKR